MERLEPFELLIGCLSALRMPYGRWVCRAFPVPPGHAGSPVRGARTREWTSAPGQWPGHTRPGQPALGKLRFRARYMRNSSRRIGDSHLVKALRLVDRVVRADRLTTSTYPRAEG